MRITVRQLEVFAAICQEQTVTGASRRIGLSQAATGHQTRWLHGDRGGLKVGQFFRDMKRGLRSREMVGRSIQTP